MSNSRLWRNFIDGTEVGLPLANQLRWLRRRRLNLLQKKWVQLSWSANAAHFLTKLLNDLMVDFVQYPNAFHLP